ncbi:MAG TPA: hypothetical protein GXZ59_07350, partial [Clostridiaceae bacterium]|nr:hypothetical protein [Clostridiaceae bacterium]
MFSRSVVKLPGLEWPCWRYPTIDSTSSEAMRLIDETRFDRALLWADKQTAGRGQRGRGFYSPLHKGLYLSFIWHCSYNLPDIKSATLRVGLLLAQVVDLWLLRTAEKGSKRYGEDVNRPDDDFYRANDDFNRTDNDYVCTAGYSHNETGHARNVEDFSYSVSAHNCTEGCGHIVEVLHHETGEFTRIKPINDLILRERKVAGILWEQYKSHHILGIGINLFPSDLPADIAATAGSVFPDLIDLDLKAMITELWQKLDRGLFFSDWSLDEAELKARLLPFDQS